MGNTSRIPREKLSHKIGARERQFASLVWRHGQLSRREIQGLTDVHPTLTGNSVATLINAGILREAKIGHRVSHGPSRGRPQIPLEIDPDRILFLGVAISPGNVRIARLDPLGRLRGAEQIRKVRGSNNLIAIACGMLRDHLDDSIHSIGISFTGLVDPISHQILFSSSQPSRSAVSLEPLYEAADHFPIILNNDMHALAMRWLLTSNAPAGDVLLVGVDDGRLGASLLIDGKPQRGTIHAANELGHMRLAVATDECYCGQTGCLERIVSTPQLARLGGKTGRSIVEVLAEPNRDRKALGQILGHLVTGLSNAVNFIRPQKLVISGPLASHPLLREFIEKHLPEMILPGLRQRLAIIFWEQLQVQSAENAAWLALADVFCQSAALDRSSFEIGTDGTTTIRTLNSGDRRAHFSDR